MKEDIQIIKMYKRKCKHPKNKEPEMDKQIEFLKNLWELLGIEGTPQRKK